MTDKLSQIRERIFKEVSEGRRTKPQTIEEERLLDRVAELETERKELAKILRLERGDEEDDEYFVPAEPEPIGPFTGIVEAARGFMEFIDKLDEQDRSKLAAAEELARAAEELSEVTRGTVEALGEYVGKDTRKGLPTVHEKMDAVRAAVSTFREAKP